MPDRREVKLPGHGVVHGVFTDRADGDLACRRGLAHAADLESRREALAPVPWTWLHQVHGAGVVTVKGPGELAGSDADSAVTSVANATLSVQVADCAPVLMFSPREGGGVVVAAAHAGWKGLLEGVLEATVEAMAELGGLDVRYWVGPCISPLAYEFSALDLEVVAERLGGDVRGLSSSGRPALDMAAAVDAAMSLAGVSGGRLGAPSVCTATSESHWSHRTAGDTQRQVGVIWWEADSAGAPR